MKISVNVRKSQENIMNDQYHLSSVEKIIDEVENLWEELKKYHILKSAYFKNYYKRFTFQMRKEKLNFEIKNGLLFIITAQLIIKKVDIVIASVKENIEELILFM